MNYLNLLKPLEYALHGGHDGVTGAFSGLESPNVAQYTTFESLYEEYKRQLLHVIDMAVETVNGFEEYLSYINPLSLLSATFPSCLEKAKDAIGGGSNYNDSVLLGGFLGDITDSLMMIQKYVYEKKELTLPALVEILDKNYAGEENLRRKLLSDPEKWGNNRPHPDAIAVDLVSFITANICGRENVRGGRWDCGFHVARMSYTQGELTAASPNGRMLGEELSKNVSASLGQSREGATAAILSATKIDATAFTCDASLDLGLLPSTVRGEDGLAGMYGLLMTFVRRGGHALHINVFDAETLRDAQAHPEKYGDLQIRVSGWNVLWNNINKEEQDGFIRQAEALK
jgi:formate C-acetyltransferase